MLRIMLLMFVRFYNLAGDTLLISTQRGPCVVGRDVVYI